MLLEIAIAVSLPVWLCVEEIARIRAQRPRPVADPRTITVREPRREGALAAKA
jgi:hypothetical protein